MLFRSVIAVNHVSFKIKERDIVSVVGQSGCGKTVLAKMLLRLEEPTSGELLYNGLPITAVRDKKQHWRTVQAVFQDPYGAFNQFFTIRSQLEASFHLFEQKPSKEEIAKRFDGMPGTDRRGGPTGAGDEWVRVGPIKLFLDGGMTNGTAYMRQPWPPGPTYQITEKDYRGLLFIEPAQLRLFVEEASRRKWQVTAHTDRKSVV